MGTTDAITPPTTPTLAQVASPPPPEFIPPWLQKTGPFFESPVVNMPAAPMEGPSAKADGVPPNSKTPQGELIRASALVQTEGAVWQVVGAEQVYKRTLAGSGNAAAAAQLVWGASKELVAAVDRELATFVGPNANPDELEKACGDLVAAHADFDPNADRIINPAFRHIIIRRLANRPDAIAAATADLDEASKRLNEAVAWRWLKWIGLRLPQLQQAAAVKQAVWSEACRKADLGTNTERQAECKRGLDNANADVERVNSRFFIETRSNPLYLTGLDATCDFRRLVPVYLFERKDFVIARNYYDAWYDAYYNALDIGDKAYIDECHRRLLEASEEWGSIRAFGERNHLLME